ncbi:hypothetical protein DINM_007362 [Dirofilaria immitis]|nr:hypothetical protein [Dirofilaria immitis]
MKKLEKLLDEGRDIQPEQPDQQLSQEGICQQYVIKKNLSRKELVTSNYIETLETLESTNKTCLEYIKTASTPSRRNEEEEKFAQITDGDKDIFNLISDGKEAKTAFSMYKNDIELAFSASKPKRRADKPTRIIQISFSYNSSLVEKQSICGDRRKPGMLSIQKYPLWSDVSLFLPSKHSIIT